MYRPMSDFGPDDIRVCRLDLSLHSRPLPPAFPPLPYVRQWKDARHVVKVSIRRRARCRILILESSACARIGRIRNSVLRWMRHHLGVKRTPPAVHNLDVGILPGFAGDDLWPASVAVDRLGFNHHFEIPPLLSDGTDGFKFGRGQQIARSLCPL